VNRRIAPAPSIIAASWCMKITMSVPMLRQTAIRMSEGSAQVVSCNQFGPVMPNQLRNPLSRPSGCRMNRHTMAIATMLVTTGA
jgi:hypothetical protein